MQTESNFNFLKYFLRVVFKRKTIILPFFFSTVLTVLIALMFFTKSLYEANSQILLTAGREHVADLTLSTGGAVRPEINFDLEQQSALTIQVLRGRLLAEQVVQSLGATVIYKDLEIPKKGFFARLFNSESDETGSLTEAATLRLLDNIHVERIELSSIINVSFTHEDPAIAARVVNTLIDLYMRRHLEVHRNPQMAVFFQEQFEALKKKLDQAQQNLESFKSQHNISLSVEAERDPLLKRRSELGSALGETQSRIGEIENRIDKVNNQLSKNQPLTRSPNAKDPANKNMVTLTALREKLAQLELREQEYAIQYTSEHPSLLGVRAEIRAIRQKLAELGGKDPRGMSASIGDPYISSYLQVELLRNESELTALNARKEALSAQLAEYQSKLEQLDRIEPKYRELQQQLDVERDNYRLYLAKSEESRIDSAMDLEKIASVRVIEPAQPPDRPQNSKAGLKLGLAIFLSLVGGIGLAFLRELLNDSFETPEDIENTLQLPVWGSIPDFKAMP